MQTVFTFRAPVLRLEKGHIQHYIPFPPDIADAFEAMGVQILECTIGGKTMRRSLFGKKDGERYVVIGQGALREIHAAYGDFVEMEVRSHPDPDGVELGEALREVLSMDPDASDRFYSFTPGRQRSLAHYVTSAKREQTRIKRALEIAEKVRTYTLYSDLQKDG